MSLIELKDAGKIYGQNSQAETKALEDISMKVERGDFISVTGPSGSGKSTLMNLLGLLDTPTSGEYTFDGQNVAKLSDKKLTHLRLNRIGFVFQSYNLLPGLSAVENVVLPMIYNKLSGKQRVERAKKLLTDVGLEKRFNHKPPQLSGGQQQRVAIARALANQPDLILADEPTGNLDSESSAAILHLLKTEQKGGTALIIVTHESEVSKLAQRQIIVKDGRLAKEAV